MELGSLDAEHAAMIEALGADYDLQELWREAFSEPPSRRSLPSETLSPIATWLALGATASEGGSLQAPISVADLLVAEWRLDPLARETARDGRRGIQTLELELVGEHETECFRAPAPVRVLLGYTFEGRLRERASFDLRGRGTFVWDPHTGVLRELELKLHVVGTTSEAGTAGGYETVTEETWSGDLQLRLEATVRECGED